MKKDLLNTLRDFYNNPHNSGDLGLISYLIFERSLTWDVFNQPTESAEGRHLQRIQNAKEFHEKTGGWLVEETAVNYVGEGGGSDQFVILKFRHDDGEARFVRLPFEYNSWDSEDTDFTLDEMHYVYPRKVLTMDFVTQKEHDSHPEEIIDRTNR